MNRWERVGPIAAAVALLFTGSLKYPSDYSDEFIAVGFVALGVWLAVEVGHIIQRRLEHSSSKTEGGKEQDETR